MEKVVQSAGSGLRVSAFLHRSATPVDSLPLIVGLHGGTYTSDYFTVAGSASGSFVDIANRNGFDVLAIDRPGYRESTPLPDEENTFARQAEVLDDALPGFLKKGGHERVVLVGHSIGGMIALEMAARRPSWRLVASCVSGMGSHIRPDGPAHGIADLGAGGYADLPIPEREAIWYGPEGSISEEAKLAARASFSPAPLSELAFAAVWGELRFKAVAGEIETPVRHDISEFDALWDSAPQWRREFLDSFRPEVQVRSEIVPGVGHCLDHHLLGAGFHLGQLGFALECSVRNA